VPCPSRSTPVPPRTTLARATARAGTLAVALAAVLTLGLAAPAGAADVQITEREPVFPGLELERFQVDLPDGDTATGHVLRKDRAAEGLELRPVQGQDRISGLETVTSMAEREFDAGALVGINGGWHHFQTDQPPAGPRGAPNGFSVLDGRVQGAQAALRSGVPRARSALGIGPDGALRTDLMAPEVTIELAGEPQASRELNRLMHSLAYDSSSQVPDPGLFLLDSQMGESFDFSERFDELAAVEVDDLPVRPGQRAAGTVVERFDDPGQLPTSTTDRTTIGAYTDEGDNEHDADRIADLDGIGVGDEVAVTVDPNPLGDTSGWDQIDHAVPGIGLVTNGRVRTVDEMEAEGVSRSSNVTASRARTAVGFADDPASDLLLVTIDEERTGSNDILGGLTLPELGAVMIELGAQHAINLDGGGSTTMTRDRALVNFPSDGSPSRGEPRSVGDGLFVYTDYPFDASERLEGTDRFATAAAVARDGFEDGAGTAVLATGADFPDALAGGAWASQRDVPLLLTDEDELPEDTVSALGDLGVQDVLIPGGTNAVSDDVADELDELGIGVDRRAGDDRYDTAAQLADPEAERAFLAAGDNFPDALTAAAPAGLSQAPMLLTDPDELPEATRDWLDDAALSEVVLVGGTAAVSQDVAEEVAEATGLTPERLSDDDRYGTAAAVIDWFEARSDAQDPSGLIVAQGGGFADALAGGPLAAARGQALMIVPPDDAESNTAASAFLDEREQLERVTLLGGPAVLSSYQHWQLDQRAGGGTAQ